MLIRFNVSNFLSFNEETEFNMLAAKSLKTHSDHVYRIKSKINVLKASAIYGANGAGKSNLVKAIQFLKNIVRKGEVPKNANNRKFKLCPDNISEPITFEIEFSYKKKIYSYGLKFDNNIVLEEWLYLSGTNQPKLIFERTHSNSKNQPHIRMADKYTKTDRAKMLLSLLEETLVKPHKLLLFNNYFLKIKDLDNVIHWINECLIIVYPESKSNQSLILYSDEEEKKHRNILLNSFQLGIDELSLKKEPIEKISQYGVTDDFIAHIKEVLSEKEEGACYAFNEFAIIKENKEYISLQMQTKHNNVIFDLNEESDGTQRLIDFIPMFRQLLREECTYIVDEIDRSLHPSIIHSLLRKIMSDTTTKGQLIFTTHESSLLNCKIFRADEIWFAEKKDDSTELYTLNEFKPRPDLDIEKGYLNGRFGAIPFLSRLEDLNWSE